MQWLTAGRGIVHCEMFPLLDQGEPNPCELFQIWLNLPAVDKLVDPYFTMLWEEDLPRQLVTDEQGRRVEITVIAGALEGVMPPLPPPDSWAARLDAEVAIWHIVLDAGAQWSVPTALHPETMRTLSVFAGSARLGAHELSASTGALVRAHSPVQLTACADGAEVLVLQGRPIGEPVAQYGPFVMNDQPGIEQAFADYRATGFGGWPWPTDDPVHARDAGRFARYPDGREVVR